MNRLTSLETDWSKSGMGFWMRQKHCSCEMINPGCCSGTGWKLCMVGSKFCSQAESNYSAVEGELCAVVWALERTKHFTMQNPQLILVTDHKPLIGLMKG